VCERVRVVAGEALEESLALALLLRHYLRDELLASDVGLLAPHCVTHCATGGVTRCCCVTHCATHALATECEELRLGVLV
jgi:hypothetical protein